MELLKEAVWQSETEQLFVFKFILHFVKCFLILVVLLVFVSDDLLATFALRSGTQARWQPGKIWAHSWHNQVFFLDTASYHY